MSKNVKPDFPMPQPTEQHEALVGFWWTNLLLKRISRKFFKQHDTSEAHFNILATLLHFEAPLTQKELSEVLLVDKSNITGLIDKLEKSELIKRENVVADRRSYHIVLTDKGRRFAEPLDELYTQHVQEVMKSFNDKEIAELIRLTRKLRIALLDSGL